MTLRERIKDLCKKNGISVNKLEMDCGFGKGYISKLDKSAPNSEKLQKIADYLGVSLDYLMTGNDASVGRFSAQADLLIKIRNDKRLMNAIEKYYDLSEKKKTHVLELIELLNEEA